MRFILLSITVISILGCGGDDCGLSYNPPSPANQTVYQSNIAAIEQYLQDNNLQANSTATGLHYIVDEEGGMARPELCDVITIAYSGYLLNGNSFDSSPGISFPLSNLIFGWQEGIPLFGKGGKGTLLIPSYLGYGAQSPSSAIPANSVLVFDIELIDF